MRVFSIRSFCLAGACALLLNGCGGGSQLAHVDTGGGGDSPDSGVMTPPSGGTDAGDMGGLPDSGTGATMSVTFRYQPAWPGVDRVELLGGFGQTTDWMKPIATLMNDGTGAFSGAVDLPIGKYAYLFRARGDTAATRAQTYQRYAIDPANPEIVACPMGAPTFSMQAMNPCSSLDLTQGLPSAASFHVKGAVEYDGQPIAGYLVELERVEPHSHHFFVNRANSGADGTFDFSVAPGHYRVQVLHPTFLDKNDDQRDPLALQAARRAISSGFMVMSDTTVAAAEVAYHSYAQMAPRTAPFALPMDFTIPLNPSQSGARLDVYGSPVGDPLYASRTSTASIFAFDGRFNTAAAKTASVAANKKYYWGSEEVGPHTMGQVQWTVQSMVFPIMWP